MKKLIISTILLSSSALLALDTQTANMLRSENLNLAQNARMIVEKNAEAEDILMGTLKNEKNPLLRDGLIYSLGSIKSKKALPQIMELAKEANQSALLALVKYEDETLFYDLPNEEIVQNAAILASTKISAEKIPTAKYFSTLSEKEQRTLLKNLPKKKGCMRFLENIDFNDPVLLMATYARLGDNGAAEKIIQIQSAHNVDISADAPALRILASCEGSELSITTAALQGNIYAIRVLKMQGIEYAEPILIALSNDSDEQIKIEAIEALATCGSEKTLKVFAQILPKVDEKYLDLYVKVSTEIYKGLNDLSKQEFRVILQKKASNSRDGTKEAIEKILAESEG